MDALFEAAFNDKHRILWYRLTPYCADHLMALDAINSPFAKDDALASAGDLVRAVRICSRRELHGTVDWSLGEMLAISILSNERLLRKAIHKFSEYLSDYNAYPDFWDEVDIDSGGTGKQLTGYPILTRVVSVLKHIPSLTEQRAWQMPIGLLVWYDEQAGELEGSGKRFWRDGEEAQMEEALRLAEESARIKQESMYVQN